LSGLHQLGKRRLFSDRHILLRSTDGIRSVFLPGWLQVVIIVVCVATLGGMSYLTMGYFSLRRSLEGSNAISRNERIPTGIPDVAKPSSEAAEVAALNQQISNINEQYSQLKQQYDVAIANQKAKATARQELQQKLDAAEQQLSANSGDVTQLKNSIDELRTELKKSEETRTAEAARAQQLDTETETLKAKILNLETLSKSVKGQTNRGGGQVTDANRKEGASPPAAVTPAAKSPETSAASAPQ
jgi:uncharacterized phage infection (PIP) family protein YhgE